MGTTVQQADLKRFGDTIPTGRRFLAVRVEDLREEAAVLAANPRIDPPRERFGRGAVRCSTDAACGHGLRRWFGHLSEQHDLSWLVRKPFPGRHLRRLRSQLIGALEPR